MTALQFLIDRLQNEYDNGDSDEKSYDEFIQDAKEFLAMEKRQIEHAFDLGTIDEIRETFKTGHEFYESVYNLQNE